MIKFRFLLYFVVIICLSNCAKLYYSYRVLNSSGNTIEVYVLNSDNLDTIKNNANNNYSGYFKKMIIETNKEEDLNAGEITDNYILIGYYNISNTKSYVIFKNSWKYAGLFDFGWSAFAKVHFNSEKAYLSKTDYIDKDFSDSLLVEVYP